MNNVKEEEINGINESSEGESPSMIYSYMNKKQFCFILSNYLSYLFAKLFVLSIAKYHVDKCLKKTAMNQPCRKESINNINSGTKKMA